MSSHKFDIALVEPEKRSAEVLKQTSYRLTTAATKDGKTNEVTVIRSVGDFVWLREKLLKKYRGCLVPMLPDSVLGFYVNPTLNDKTFEFNQMLRKFLTRITIHPELSQSSDLDAFLHTADEQVFMKLKEEKEEKPSRSLMNSVKESFHLVTSKIPGITKEREKTADDIACEKILNYANAIETLLSSLRDNTDTLFRSLKGLSSSWSEFGLSVSRFANFETKQNEQNLGNILSVLGTNADFLSTTLINHTADNETLLDALRDYVSLTKSVQVLMKGRATMLTAYNYSLSTLESEQSALTKVHGLPGKEEKALAQEKLVIEAQAQVDREKAELHDVTQQCLAEVQRFQKEKFADLKAVVAHFCTLQIEHLKKLTNSWENVLKKVNAA